MYNIHLNKSRKIVTLSMLVAQAIVLSIIESFIPISFIIPGVKPGLANIVTIVSLYYFSLKDVLIIILVRSILTALFSGNIYMFFFSMSGGILSTLFMGLLIKKFRKYFSTIGISVSGAFFHNLGQILVAYTIVKSSTIFFLLPILMISGIIMGCITGYISYYLLNNLDGVFTEKYHSGK
ncbi:MAG: Gx transporter family protein [Clostridiales bacterium]